MLIYIKQFNPIIGALESNTNAILSTISQAKEKKADLVIFPELCLCGYPPKDFLLLPHFLNDLDQHLQRIIQATKGINAIVGTVRKNPLQKEKPLFNSSAILQNGKLLGYQDKILLPTYDVFDERRYFEPGNHIRLWKLFEKKIAITICEDLWQHGGYIPYSNYQRDPILELKDQSPDLLINISSSPFSINKPKNRVELCSKTAKTLQCPVILCNQVGGNDGLIFDGHSLYMNKQGKLLQQGRGFAEDDLLIDTQSPPKTCSVAPSNTTELLYRALVLGTRDYFNKSKFSKACLGLSGGIDSAIVASIAVEALGKSNVLAISMPSRYSSQASVKDAKQLSENLGIQQKTIPIEEPFQSYLNLLTPFFEGKAQDTTEENLQARIRGMILMAISNKLGYIVLGTGNKSELAMGYSTLYGDLCGGLGVISDVSKKQVYTLAHWINRNEELIPKNIINKAPSAELRPNQKDSDSLPEYEIIDNVLKDYLEQHLSPEVIASKHQYSLKLVNTLIKKIHQSEYKRRQSPPSLKISEKSFSTGYHFPIAQQWIC